MLQSLLGIRLVLLLGRALPLPAPVEISAALTRAEVTNDSETGDGFQLTFACARTSLVDYALVGHPLLAPMTRIVIGVLFGASPEVLIDGVITHAQFQPGADPGQAQLTVTGRDLSVLLDLEEKAESYANQPDSVIFTRIVAGYARYGIAPQPTPTPNVPIVLDRVPQQHETDLRFIQRLAARNGFVFYLEPLTFGACRAYFGPENRLSIPQPALSINQGAVSNVKNLNFAFDALAPTGTKGVVLLPFLKFGIPIPPLPTLKIPPLALAPAPALRTTLQRNTARQNAATAATTALAERMNARDAATADGELDGVRYGGALRARKLVGVSGAGFTHDGLWMVKKVTHTITPGEYAQKFSLSREGQGSLLPVVRR